MLHLRVRFKKQNQNNRILRILSQRHFINETSSTNQKHLNELKKYTEQLTLSQMQTE